MQIEMQLYKEAEEKKKDRKTSDKLKDLGIKSFRIAGRAAGRLGTATVDFLDKVVLDNISSIF